LECQLREEHRTGRHELLIAEVVSAFAVKESKITGASPSTIPSCMLVSPRMRENLAYVGKGTDQENSDESLGPREILHNRCGIFDSFEEIINSLEFIGCMGVREY